MQRLVASDARLWLSRSWTTRARRPGEADDAYVFVDAETFEARAADDGFLETNRFAGNDHWYGTPLPEGQADRDVLLEIDLNGARQVRERLPEAKLVLVVPPDVEELERRLRGRGDDEEHVRSRLALAESEVAEGQAIAHHIVVNDDLDRAVAEVAGILDGYRCS